MTNESLFAYLFTQQIFIVYYVPGCIENAGVTMVSSNCPAGLPSTDDKSVNKDASQVILDPDKSREENKAG